MAGVGACDDCDDSRVRVRRRRCACGGRDEEAAEGQETEELVAGSEQCQMLRSTQQQAPWERTNGRAHRGFAVEERGHGRGSEQCRSRVHDLDLDRRSARGIARTELLWAREYFRPQHKHRPYGVLG